jgi:hypothetical protein
MKLNGTHQLLVYAFDGNLLGDSIDTIKKKMETLFVASKEVGLEVNTRKTKYVAVSSPECRAKSCHKVANRCFENVAKFRYLGRTITNENLIQEEMERKFNSGNACYHSVRNLFSSRLLSRNIKIRIYKTIILPAVLYGCETWSLTLMEEHRLREFENRVLRRMCGPKRDEVTGDWRKLHDEEFHNLYSSPNIIRMMK